MAYIQKNTRILLHPVLFSFVVGVLFFSFLFFFLFSFSAVDLDPGDMYRRESAHAPDVRQPSHVFRPTQEPNVERCTIPQRRVGVRTYNNKYLEYWWKFSIGNRGTSGLHTQSIYPDLLPSPTQQKSQHVYMRLVWYKWQAWGLYTAIGVVHTGTPSRVPLHGGTYLAQPPPTSTRVIVSWLN